MHARVFDTHYVLQVTVQTLQKTDKHKRKMEAKMGEVKKGPLLVTLRSLLLPFPVCSCLSIFLYACESWTLTAELQRRIQAMEMRCYRKILRISYKDHVINEEVRAKIQQAIRPHEDLLTIVKRHKLQWYGHVSLLSGKAETILQGLSLIHI